MLHRFDEAASVFRECLQLMPGSRPVSAMLAACCGRLGLLSEAAALRTSFTPETVQFLLATFRDPAQQALLLEGLTKAGVDV
jgi:hypothetical protein